MRGHVITKSRWPWWIADASVSDLPHDVLLMSFVDGGRLAWDSSDIDGDYVVSILSERVWDEYLTFLRERDVSYLVARVWGHLQRVEHGHVPTFNALDT
ncbi:MAG: hypothetical protein JWM95_1613 [Gemmatimonadetes bacterium]|nr:hypothetical protein [Gemmatimonadota bacterium]